MSKGKGFKKVPWSLRERLNEFSGSELKVWLHAYLYSGKDNHSTLDNARIMRDIDLCENTVTTAKAGLRRKGFLTKVGDLPSKQGQFSLPIFCVGIPDHRTQIMGTEPYPNTGDGTVPKKWGMDRTQKMGTIVDTLYSSQQKELLTVNTKAVEVKEVSQSGSQASDIKTEDNHSTENLEKLKAWPGIEALVTLLDWEVDEDELELFLPLIVGQTFWTKLLWFPTSTKWVSRIHSVPELVQRWKSVGVSFSNWYQAALSRENSDPDEIDEYLSDQIGKAVEAKESKGSAHSEPSPADETESGPDSVDPTSYFLSDEEYEKLLEDMKQGKEV